MRSYVSGTGCSGSVREFEDVENEDGPHLRNGKPADAADCRK
jgi:hypothetical protein